MGDETAEPQATATRRRPALRVGAIVGGLAILYVIVLLLYASGGRVADVAGEPPTDDAILLLVEPQSVNAVGNRMTVTVDLVEYDALADEDQLTLTEDLDVLISEADGERTIRFPAGRVPGAVSVELITSGVVEQWPFDSHTTVTTFVALHTVGGETQALPTHVAAAGRVPGWNISAAAVPLDGSVVIDDVEVPLQGVEFVADRSGSTIAFGALLLGLMIVMPVLVLTVAITAYQGRRKIEASFMSWMAAMLFATVPLRNFLPGAPPIGSWIDFAIVLWVIVGLVAGLVIYVLAWRKWSSPQEGVRR